MQKHRKINIKNTERRIPRGKRKIVQIMGPVVDVEFPQNALPAIKDALTVENNGKNWLWK